MTDIAIALRVACILAIDDIEAGFPQKAKVRLKSIISSIDKRAFDKPDDSLSCQEWQDKHHEPCGGHLTGCSYCPSA